MKASNAEMERRENSATTILVVEDDPLILEVEKGILSRAGYHVLFAADGVDGAVLFARNFEQIDLLVTDICMPGMGGTELAAFARKIRSDLQVLFASGSIQKADGAAKEQREGIEYLPKPFAPKELLQIVKELIGQGRRKRLETAQEAMELS